jgi:hypothetical protein
MNKLSSIIIGIFLTLMALISTFAPTASVFADNTQGTTIGDVTEPGILPDSGFYFMKNWSRSLQLMFAASNAERAELNIRYANEDVLALKKLCDIGKCDIAARFTEQYELQLQNAIQNVEQARLQQGDQTAVSLTSKLEQNYLRQQEVLAGVLEQAPQSAQEGILNAIENSNRHMEKLILEQQGEAALEQYQEQVTQQTNNMGEGTSLKIQQRLEASHGQSNKPSTVPDDSQQVSDNVTGSQQQAGQENVPGQGGQQSSGQGPNKPDMDDHGNKKQGK